MDGRFCNAVPKCCGGCQEDSPPSAEDAYRAATTRAVLSHSYAASGASPCIQTDATCCSSPRSVLSLAKALTCAGLHPSSPAAPERRRPLIALG
eukprot:2481387-Prorocentrum_lima.AAC.1